MDWDTWIGWYVIFSSLIGSVVIALSVLLGLLLLIQKIVRYYRG